MEVEDDLVERSPESMAATDPGKNAGRTRAGPVVGPQLPCQNESNRDRYKRPRPPQLTTAPSRPSADPFA